MKASKERNARMTSSKHFFIAKVLDPLLISLSTDKRTLSVDETIQFKVERGGVEDSAIMIDRLSGPN